MSTPTTLSAAAQDRKARLAQLKSLKRKAPEPSESTTDAAPEEAQNEEQAVEHAYLSGRNFDLESRGPKLGFESAPTAGKNTLEQQAAALALSTQQEAEAEEKNDAPLDLFKLQPKKPNWDLKRELNERMEVLDLRTDNAIARLVRQRVGSTQKGSNGDGGVEGVAAALGGGELVEAIRAREREELEDERREREFDAEGAS